MELSHDEVKYIARLARLKLSQGEVEKFSIQLTEILSWVEMLKEVNVEGVTPTSQVTGLITRGRPDEVIPSSTTRDELLDCSELPKEARQVRVKSVL